jgi:anthranilate synthase/aminodeoxychorismate synthase-like glutamine amidotransferase
VILLVDNYDSFTYNLLQLIASRGRRVEVVRNDAESAREMLARRPAGIVISPGPGRPEEAGVAVELLRLEPPIPVLGVCLGLQAMAVAWGGLVERAPRLMHGKTSMVRHRGVGIFAGLPNPFEATRYHSLAVVEGHLPEALESVAWSEEGTLQAVRHRHRPYWGVQFHPESVLTLEGPRLVDNFLALCDPPRAAA